MKPAKWSGFIPGWSWELLRLGVELLRLGPYMEPLRLGFPNHNGRDAKQRARPTCALWSRQARFEPVQGQGQGGRVVAGRLLPERGARVNICLTAREAASE